MIKIDKILRAILYNLNEQRNTILSNENIEPYLFYISLAVLVLSLSLILVFYIRAVNAGRNLDEDIELTSLKLSDQLFSSFANKTCDIISSHIYDIDKDFKLNLSDDDLSKATEEYYNLLTAAILERRSKAKKYTLPRPFVWHSRLNDFSLKSESYPVVNPFMAKYALVKYLSDNDKFPAAVSRLKSGPSLSEIIDNINR